MFWDTPFHTELPSGRAPPPASGGVPLLGSCLHAARGVSSNCYAIAKPKATRITIESFVDHLGSLDSYISLNHLPPYGSVLGHMSTPCPLGFKLALLAMPSVAPTTQLLALSTLLGVDPTTQLVTLNLHSSTTTASSLAPWRLCLRPE